MFPETLATVSRITDDYAVTHFEYDSHLGWSIELAKPSHETDAGPRPDVKELPTDVREALLAWLQQ